MDANLAAMSRDERGKNNARRLRRTGQIPAVVYGQQTSGAMAVAVDPKTLLQIFHSESGVNTLISLSVDGGSATQVLVKDYQLDPVSNQLLHVDLYQPPLDRAITVSVPVTLVGEAVGVKQQGGLVDFVHREVQIECLPTQIPDDIEVDISDLMIGQGVRLGDVTKNVEWTAVDDQDTLLVHVIPPIVEDLPEDEAAAEAEAAEGEAGAEAEAGTEKAEGGDGGDGE